MKIGILSEQNDQRVAVVPAVAKKLTDLGATILLEKNAGLQAGFSDDKYDQIEKADRAQVISQSDMLIGSYSDEPRNYL